MIVGGGTVGVELAAEIVGRWRNKVVTLVASQRRLLERMPEGASKYAYKWLTARDVEVVRQRATTGAAARFCYLLLNDAQLTLCIDAMFASP